MSGSVTVCLNMFLLQMFCLQQTCTHPTRPFISKLVQPAECVHRLVKKKKVLILFGKHQNKKKAWYFIYLAQQKIDFILCVMTVLTLIRHNGSSCQLNLFLNTCLGNWREIARYFICLSVRSSFKVDGVCRSKKQPSKQIMDLIMEAHKSLKGS